VSPQLLSLNVNCRRKLTVL